MTKRHGVHLSEEAFERLKDLQKEFGQKVGFEPSLTQVIEYLVLKETQKRQTEE
jgi:hypothetical protein